MYIETREKKERAVDDLRSLLRTKESTLNNDVLLFHCNLLHVATDEELKSVKQNLEQKEKEIDDLRLLLKTKEGKYFVILKYGIFLYKTMLHYNIH